MPIPTKDELCRKAQPRSEVIAFPALGEGVELKIRGWSFQQSKDIRDASILKDQDGKVVEINQDTDRLLSVIAALEEPHFEESDAGLIAEWGVAILDDIIAEAMRLSGRTVDAFEQFKRELKENPHMRRIYNVCRTQFNRLPSEIGPEVTAEEFQRALAEIELEQEETMQALQEAQGES